MQPWREGLLSGIVCGLLGLLLEGCGRHDHDHDHDHDHSHDGFLDVEKPDRLGSFLVIGDWGWNSEMHGNLNSSKCQQAIADSMNKTMSELGDVKFVINVGDSFYPRGVNSTSDPLWDDMWRDVYSPELRSVPWYSVYGNHDYLVDPCACSEDINQCMQVNADIEDRRFFYMPDTSWYLQHPELETEVIAMDLNYYTWLNHTCEFTGCYEACAKNLKKRADDAFNLFNDRVAASNATNLLVFSHYPTDYFPGPEYNESAEQHPWSPSWVWMDEEELSPGLRSFIPALSNASRGHIEYFGGHRHNVDQTSTASTAPQSNWLVGGGGGWGTDGKDQGFVVGEIRPGGKVTTRPVIVDWSYCSS